VRLHLPISQPLRFKFPSDHQGKSGRLGALSTPYLRYYMTLSTPDGTDENLECLPLLKQSNLEESVIGTELHSLVVYCSCLPRQNHDGRIRHRENWPFVEPR
jgi:hypothetical protein